MISLHDFLVYFRDANALMVLTGVAMVFATRQIYVVLAPNLCLVSQPKS